MSIIGNPIMAGASGPSASIFVTGLSETDTVTATNGSKTLDGKWTQKPNPAAHGLPDGYTELEYIESTGTQYINTGIPACSNTHVICVSEANNSYAECLFGSRVASENKDIRVLFGSESYFISGLWDETYGYTEKLSSTNYLGKRKFEIRNKGIYVDDALVYQNPSSASGTGTNNIYLFAMNDNGSVASKGSWTIYSAEFYNGNIMTGRFVPCKRNSDSSIGMYDLVTSTFFENAGTGTFTAGAEVPQTFDGFLIKPIRDLGTWTVTATDGTDTYTQDVLVDVITDYEIEITKKLYLYRDGNECEDITGGWSAIATEGYIYTLTKNDTDMTISSGTSTNYTSFLSIANKIDISNYSKACIEWDLNMSSWTQYSAAKFGIGETTDSIVGVKSVDITENGSKTTKLDISSETGQKYVGCYFNTGDGGVLTATIHKIWLEK